MFYIFIISEIILYELDIAIFALANRKHWDNKKKKSLANKIRTTRYNTEFKNVRILLLKNYKKNRIYAIFLFIIDGDRIYIIKR